jgi:hypothetical protein
VGSPPGKLTLRKMPREPQPKKEVPQLKTRMHLKPSTLIILRLRLLPLTASMKSLSLR